MTCGWWAGRIWVCRGAGGAEDGERATEYEHLEPAARPAPDATG
jgi:hypothetical protein